MKFLVDNQLPLAVAYWIARIGFDSIHVSRLGLEKSTDREIWDAALQQNRIVVSKDEDFFILATRPCEEGRLLWLRLGNMRTNPLIRKLEERWEEIIAAFFEGQRIVEFR